MSDPELRFALYGFLFCTALAGVGAVCILLGYRLFERGSGLFRAVDRLAIKNREFTISITGMSAGGALMATSVIWGYWAHSSRPQLERTDKTVRITSPLNREEIWYSLVSLSYDTANVLKLTVPTLTTLASPAPLTHETEQVLQHKEQPEVRLAIGDVVGVTIFEAAVGSLFVPRERGGRPGNFVTLPNQTVDPKGNISVPYAGVVRAAGRTVTEVQRDIESALKGRALEPQAVVVVVARSQSIVSVFGEVNEPSGFPLTAAGMTVSEAIALAGGPKDGVSGKWLLVERGGRQVSIPLEALYSERSNNIQVREDDVLYVFRKSQTFLVLAPSGEQKQFPFETWSLSLERAFEIASDLIKPRRQGILLLYRGERRDTAMQLGIDITPFSGPIIPVLYYLNLSQQDTPDLLKKIRVRDKDVIALINDELGSLDSNSKQLASILEQLKAMMGTSNDPILAAAIPSELLSGSKSP
jgi:polysaccharide export outer membrane protein